MSKLADVEKALEDYKGVLAKASAAKQEADAASEAKGKAITKSEDADAILTSARTALSESRVRLQETIDALTDEIPDTTARTTRRR